MVSYLFIVHRVWLEHISYRVAPAIKNLAAPVSRHGLRGNAACVTLPAAKRVVFVESPVTKSLPRTEGPDVVGGVGKDRVLHNGRLAHLLRTVILEKKEDSGRSSAVAPAT